MMKVHVWCIMHMMSDAVDPGIQNLMYRFFEDHKTLQMCTRNLT